MQDLKLRTDAEPAQLLKELALYPLIYLRLVGVVSIDRYINTIGRFVLCVNIQLVGGCG